MTGTEEQVVLVNEHDQALGQVGKLEAHQRGLLHRAFSVFVFDPRGRLLLQQRAAGKYHSAGLWTNTCCSHPRPGEEILNAAGRRLQEEMGIRCSLEPVFSFMYKEDVGQGLVEHELDHVLFGVYQGPIAPAAEEVAAYQWMRLHDLADDLRTSPERYTRWLHRCFPQVLQHHLQRAWS